MDHLPDLLRRFYERNVPHPPRGPLGALIEQSGQIRLSPSGKWLPFTAEQWFAATKTAFRWHARIKLAPLVTAVVEDAFEDGHGRLDVKLWSVIPVAHERGLDIDRGEAQRYLAELPWNPMAIAHNPDLHFSPGEAGAVRVWCGDEKTHVDLRSDADGDLVGVFTRTRSMNGEPRPWEGHFSDYAEMSGVRIPTRAEVMWHLPDGPFPYWRGTITSFHWREAIPIWITEPPAIAIPV